MSEKAIYPENERTVSPPARKLATNRSALKMVLLGILTFGIYPMIIYCYMSEDINILASRHDGKRTVHMMVKGFLNVLTIGIYHFVWMHKLCGRIGRELERRGCQYRFSAGHFWLLDVLGRWVAGVLIFAITFLADSTALIRLSRLEAVIGNQELLRNYAPYILRGLSAFTAWGIFLSIIASVVFHLIFVHKYCKAMNLLAEDYNQRG